MKPLSLLVTNQRCFTRLILFSACRQKRTSPAAGPRCSAGPLGGEPGQRALFLPGLLRGLAWGCPVPHGQQSSVPTDTPATQPPAGDRSPQLNWWAELKGEALKQLATRGTRARAPESRCTVCLFVLCRDGRQGPTQGRSIGCNPAGALTLSMETRVCRCPALRAAV